MLRSCKRWETTWREVTWRDFARARLHVTPVALSYDSSMTWWTADVAQWYDASRLYRMYCKPEWSGKSFSHFLWSELYCHLLLRPTRRRRVVCPIRKLPTWLTLVGLILRVFDPLPVARMHLTCDWELLERICRCFLHVKELTRLLNIKDMIVFWSI